MLPDCLEKAHKHSSFLVVFPLKITPFSPKRYTKPIISPIIADFPFYGNRKRKKIYNYERILAMAFRRLAVCPKEASGP